MALSVVFAAVSIGVGGAAAQSTPLIEVSPMPDFEETQEVAVRLSGLDSFDGGTAAMYVCANADTSGDPIVATAQDCFSPDSDGFVFDPIIDAGFEGVYVLRLDGIGTNQAQCLLPDNGAASCQLVVATTLNGDAKITGVALDPLLARLASTRLADTGSLPTASADDATAVDTAEVDELANTGLSAPATFLLLLGAAALF